MTIARRRRHFCAVEMEGRQGAGGNPTVPLPQLMTE